ncbi:MAG: hypothetical protein KAU44_04565 [Candidatus Marinimicrobia bacterium]|nr:hypothetical protein [Candidatus Neomarinimicrobiota bacterium]
MIRERKVIRLQSFDYSRPKDYFVTIEPDNKKYLFSKIIDGEIILNKIGRIIDEQWKWLFDQYPYIKIDEYVIMPDHFHGIIRYLPDHIIPKNPPNPNIPEYVREAREPPVRDKKAIPESFLHSQKIKPLPEIIGAFKTTSSKKIHFAGYSDFKWKRSFNDRILQDNELGIKRAYIRNNPLKK